MLEELLLFLVEAVWCVAFPAVHTLKSLKPSGVQPSLYQQWTYYWILYALLSACEGFINWLPGFAYLRILLIAYLAFPPLKGPMTVYGLLDAQVLQRVKPILSALAEQVKPQN